MTTPASTRNDLSEVLRRILILEGQHRVARVAAALHVPPSTLYARIHRGARFDPDEFAILLREVPDERLIRWLFVGSDLFAVKQPVTRETARSRPFLALLANCAAACVAALCELLDVLECAPPCDMPGQHPEDHLDRAQGELLLLRLQLSAEDRSATATPAGDRPEAFGALVRHVLVGQNGAEIRDIADALAMSYHALHARLSGRSSFSPEELRRLFRLYPEPRIGDYLLAETPYITIRQPAVTDPYPAYTPLRAGLQALHEVIALLQNLLQAADRHEVEDHVTVRSGVEEALRQLAALRWNLTHIGRPTANPALTRLAILRGMAAFERQSGQPPTPSPEARTMNHSLTDSRMADPVDREY